MTSSILNKRFNKFKNNKRAWYSLIILMFSYIISIFSPFIANDQPLFVIYKNILFFPVLKYYPPENFDEPKHMRIDYKKLSKREDFKSGKGIIVFPAIPFSYNEDNLENLEPGVNPPTEPSTKHILGTDDRGRDVFTRILYGYRNAMTFGLLLVMIEMIIGSFMGGVQGYFAGALDITMQRIIEVLSAIPFLYLILIMGAMFGRGFGILMVTYGALSWIGISYYMRGEFYRIKSYQYVEAARALGVSPFRIIQKHIFPNAITPLVTFLPFSLISAISILSALDFLGYGIPAPNPSWGELIGQGREHLTAWWLIAFPSIALFITILLTSFIGEGLRDAFDSRDKIEYI